MSTTRIVNYINTKTKLNDKRYYMSLLYFAKYIIKDLSLKYLDQQKIRILPSSNYWLDLLNEKSKNHLYSSERINSFLEYKFNLWEKIYGLDYVKKAKRHYENIGLFEVLKDRNINEFISLIDNSEFSLDDWVENSDHDLDIQQLNNYNFYKDKIRTLEIQARISGK
jgi:hypothetical protein